MQAIETKYLGPTNSRGSRIKATCDFGSVTIPWDHALSAEGNHDNALRAMVNRMTWPADAKWYRGGLANGRSVYVYAAEFTEVRDV